MAVPSKTSQVGYGVVGGLTLGFAGAPSAPAVTHVRVTQEVVEAVFAPVTAVRVTQEVAEVVLAPITNVRVTQEAVEAVVPFVPETDLSAEWVVEPSPLVFWRAEIETASDQGDWIVRASPRVYWTGQLTNQPTAWVVHTAPIVIWDVGAGSAGTDCISAPGDMPDPVDPPAEPGPGPLNYVF